MSKHSDAEARLHISGQLRHRANQPKRAPMPIDKAAPQVPPKGTQANNQYR